MADKILYSMGEVAELFDVNASLIRHWESQFSIVRPQRNKKGNRLFSQQDVDHLKVIYHLVKERGMTLEGAKKALRQHRSEGSVVQRDTELMERLQHIRSLLVEVREDLKQGDGEIRVEEQATASESVESEAAASRRRANPVVRIDESEAPDSSEGAAPGSSTPRRPRRKKEDAETKELFAFYEQSLF